MEIANGIYPQRRINSHSGNIIATCCSTDSGRPHRCCHQPNIFGSHILHNGPGDDPPPKKKIIVPSPEDSGPTEYIISRLTRVHLSPKRHLDWFSRFSTVYGCDQQKHTQTTEHQQQTINRLQLMFCLAMRPKLQWPGPS